MPTTREDFIREALREIEEMAAGANRLPCNPPATEEILCIKLKSILTTVREAIESDDNMLKAANYSQAKEKTNAKNELPSSQGTAPNGS